MGARYRICEPASAPAGTAGSSLGKSSGSSLEFLDHRDYQPGDDLRMIDWPVMARTDRLVVKLYRQEFTPHVDVLLDGTGSMALRGTAKADAAMRLSAAIATAAENAGFTHRFRVTGQDRELSAVGQDILAWPQVQLRGGMSPSAWLMHSGLSWRPRSLRVFISDLLFAEEPAMVLRPLSDGAAGLFVLQLLAREDAQPQRLGNVQLVDCETGDLRQVYVDLPALERYRQALSRHQQNWRRSCREVGAAMAVMTAEDVCQGGDLSPLVEMALLRPS